MAKRDILSVACKILGVYVLLRAVGMLPWVVSMMTSAVTFQRSDPAVVLFQFWSLSATGIGLVLLAAVSFCLIKWADLVAGVLCAGEEREAIKEAPGIEAVEEIAFVAVGVFVIADALGMLARTALRIAFLGGPDKMSLSRDGGDLIGLGVTLVIGAYLVLGARGLARAIDRWRRA